MIIRLNGPFGVGRSTLAAELHRTLMGSLVADPERVGDVPAYRRRLPETHAQGHVIDASALAPGRTHQTTLAHPHTT
ncbi:hypothetical protein [Streptomyces halstedii]|uniref:hypothetical protein n=1 Tax=Streptomyces halstedii TaxID=1944 RepID=UPI0037FA86B2